MSDEADVRKARNEATFRAANEGIRQVREGLPDVDAPTPFLCECERPACGGIVRLELDEYEAVRAHPARFLVALGHPATTGVVVHETDRYAVVEKQGVARDVAEATDPRTRSA